jgi:hypothetical protein
MAVLKANYVKKGETEKARAKATIKYIQHRPGKDHERKARTLFGSDGPMGRWQAYRMIDEAPKGRFFYWVIINPTRSLRIKSGIYLYAKLLKRPCGRFKHCEKRRPSNGSPQSMMTTATNDISML